MLLLALDLVSYPFMGQFTLANFGHTQFKVTQPLDFDKSSLVCPFDFRLKNDHQKSYLQCLRYLYITLLINKLMLIGFIPLLVQIS